VHKRTGAKEELSRYPQGAWWKAGREPIARRTHVASHRRTSHYDASGGLAGGNTTQAARRRPQWRSCEEQTMW
jgi:hypothetical protein